MMKFFLITEKTKKTQKKKKKIELDMLTKILQTTK